MSDNPFLGITDLLFVYGTLMQGYRNEFAAQLHRESTCVGVGWFSGRLYQIDWFPGAIHDTSVQTRVWGEIYQLQNPATTLLALDVYEGVDEDPPTYLRRVVPVSMDGGIISCETYLYNLPTSGLKRIESGRFQQLL